MPKNPRVYYTCGMIKLDPSKWNIRALRKETCGTARIGKDNYDDVLLACERKLREWERMGIIARPELRSNDWLFTRRKSP